MQCENCRNEVQFGARVCPYCHSKLLGPRDALIGLAGIVAAGVGLAGYIKEKRKQEQQEEAEKQREGQRQEAEDKAERNKYHAPRHMLAPTHIRPLSDPGSLTAKGALTVVDAGRFVCLLNPSSSAPEPFIADRRYIDPTVLQNIETSSQTFAPTGKQIGEFKDLARKLPEHFDALARLTHKPGEILGMCELGGRNVAVVSTTFAPKTIRFADALTVGVGVHTMRAKYVCLDEDPREGILFYGATDLFAMLQPSPCADMVRSLAEEEARTLHPLTALTKIHAWRGFKGNLAPEGNFVVDGCLVLDRRYMLPRAREFCTRTGPGTGGCELRIGSLAFAQWLDHRMSETRFEGEVLGYSIDRTVDDMEGIMERERQKGNPIAYAADEGLFWAVLCTRGGSGWDERRKVDAFRLRFAQWACEFDGVRLPPDGAGIVVLVKGGHPVGAMAPEFATVYEMYPDIIDRSESPSSNGNAGSATAGETKEQPPGTGLRKGSQGQTPATSSNEPGSGIGAATWLLSTIATLVGVWWVLEDLALWVKLVASLVAVIGGVCLGMAAQALAKMKSR